MKLWLPELKREGRLTAGINYYRQNANLLFESDFPKAKIPVFGIYAENYACIVEESMANSKDFVDNTFVYKKVENCRH